MRPDDVAFTFTDYADDPAGISESLTWSQLSRRTIELAGEIGARGAVGDRAVILAPQGLEYILAFLGAMQAGLIAVPLPMPHRGAGDERVSAVFADTEPSVVLTTPAAAQEVGDHIDQSRVLTAPKVVEIGSTANRFDGAALPAPADPPETAYLQYSSGSTRQPTGVMISHRNLQANFEQLMRALFAGANGRSSTGMTIVSWLPFYHDMGLVLGVCAPILGGFPARLTSPVAFLEQPARWIRALAQNDRSFSAAPNFAFDLAARKTADRDLAGLDLGGVLGIINGAERVDPATLARFTDRFAHFDFRDHMLRPSYGLAEATVFVASGSWSEAADDVRFDADALSRGIARPCPTGRGPALVRYADGQSPMIRIVDVDTNRECAANVVGEIWVHGDNVASGYWSRPPEEQTCFGAILADPSAGAPDGPWLRTGDLGFRFEGGLYIVGRIKDLLIIRGRNHYPEDIEATVQEITHGRVAAFSVPAGSTETLVIVIELKNRSGDDAEAVRRFDEVKSAVTAAVSNTHGLSVDDLVLVAAGSLPTTTSGKIRRAACTDRYRQNQFARLDT